MRLPLIFLLLPFFCISYDSYIYIILITHIWYFFPRHKFLFQEDLAEKTSMCRTEKTMKKRHARDLPHLEISSSFRHQSPFLRFVHFQLHGVLHALRFKREHGRLRKCTWENDETREKKWVKYIWILQICFSQRTFRAFVNFRLSTAKKVKSRVRSSCLSCRFRASNNNSSFSSLQPNRRRLATKALRLAPPKSPRPTKIAKTYRNKCIQKNCLNVTTNLSGSSFCRYFIRKCPCP